MKRLKYLLLVLILALAGSAMAACSIGGVDLDKLGYTARVKFVYEGAVLDTSGAQQADFITYAYKPDSHIVDPTKMPNYALRKDGYTFEGWYKDEACTVPFDFKTEKVSEGEITLYSKWNVLIRYTYSLHYTDENGEDHVLQTITVNPGTRFEGIDIGKINKWQGHTPVYEESKRYFKDAALTKPWDDTFTHPGGETDHDEPIYVKFIEGDWVYISTAKEFASTINSRKNLYLVDNIDFANGPLSLRLGQNPYNGIIEGNGYEVRNIQKDLTGNVTTIDTSLFARIGGNCEIRNIKFVNYTIKTASVNYNFINVSALAYEAVMGARISNVSVQGTFNLANGITIAGKDKPITQEQIDGIKEDLLKAIKVETKNTENDTAQISITNFSSNFAFVQEPKTEE